jgi:N-terminal acetyltransferase B complex catalytic subunit
MTDLFKFNNINLDHLTETFNMPFYLTYLSTWPEAFTVAESPDSSLMGYMLAKAEGVGTLWHGHVSAVTVAPTYRRLGLARVLMEDLERFSEQVYNAYFVDLFVRASNKLAIDMYEKFGYVKYRRVLGYYSGEGGGSGAGESDDDDEDDDNGMNKDGSEDAWDMRKALKRDVEKKSIIPLDHPVLPGDLEW